MAAQVASLVAGDPATLADPHPLYRALREAGGVHEHGDLLLLARYDDVKEAYRRGDSFARGQTRGKHLLAQVEALPEPQREAWREVAGFSQGFMIRSRYDEHNRLRKIAHRAFTPRRVAALDQAVADHAADLLGELAGAGPVDLTPLAYRMPLLVLMDMLGIPAADQEMVHSWSGTITAQIGSVGRIDPAVLMAAHRAIGEFDDYIEAMLDQRLRGSGSQGDLLADLLDAEGEGRMTTAEVTAMFAELLIAGHETTTALIANGLVALLRNRDQWDWLCENVDQVPAAVEELLRYVSPVATNPRALEESAEFGGRTFAKGTTVLPLLAAANRDPAVFREPEALDLRRPDAGAHVAFGFGPHFCIGNQLARREAAAALGAVAAEYPDVVLEDDPLDWFGTVMLRRPRTVMVDLRAQSTAN